MEKNPHAVALGRLGGRVGGPARAASMTPERRREIPRAAAQARWSRARHARMELARTIASETGADVGILEHSLRLLDLSPMERLEQSLALGRLVSSLRRVSP